MEKSIGGEMKEWIDVTVPLKRGMTVWPGDPEVILEWIEEIGNGGAANLSRMAMGMHSGTHIDAPLHFLRGGRSIDAMPPETFVGPARVIAVDHPDCIRGAALADCTIEEGDRILLRSANSKEGGESAPAPFGLDPEAARVLANCRVRAVGIEGLSISRPGDEEEVHRTLLEAGIWILEGLDLSRVKPGLYELLCLPLLIPGAEAAPARAFLRPLEASQPTSL